MSPLLMLQFDYEIRLTCFAKAMTCMRKIFVVKFTKGKEALL